MPILKVDLAMWTKNGEQFLREVLNSIEQALPEENINHGIIVDDHGEEQTVRIVKVSIDRFAKILIFQMKRIFYNRHENKSMVEFNLRNRSGLSTQENRQIPKNDDKTREFDNNATR